MTRPRRASLGRLPALVALAALLGACRQEVDGAAEAHAITQGGDARQGAVHIRRYGCGACHVIPGIPGARGTVGPSLASMRGRSFIAGVLPHTPENVVRWIVDPPAVDSMTAMPALGVTTTDARDIAAYLYAHGR